MAYCKIHKMLTIKHKLLKTKINQFYTPLRHEHAFCGV